MGREKATRRIRRVTGQSIAVQRITVLRITVQSIAVQSIAVAICYDSLFHDTPRAGRQRVEVVGPAGSRIPR